MGSKVIRNITKVFRSASGVLFGRVTAGTGRGEELTPSQVRSLLSVYTITQTDTAISTAVNALVAGAPGLLDTLDELSAALGDDANFASTVTTALAGKVDSSSLNESIDDRVAALLVAGTNISLTYNDASGTLTIASTAGGLSGTGNVDNAALRADGTGGATLQSSAWIINDNLTASPNNTVNHACLEATGGTTNVSVSVKPKGSGAFCLNAPDGTTTGGNARGAYAVDLQMERSVSSQVAGAQYSFCANHRNTVTASTGSAFGELNTVSGEHGFCGGGYNNTVSTSQAGACLGGKANTVSGSYSNTVLGGESNTSSGNRSSVIAGQASVSSGLCTIASGEHALADRSYMRAHAGSRFSTTGDSQYFRFPMRIKTTTNTPTTMMLDGASTRLTLNAGEVFSFVVRICGVKSDGTAFANYTRRGIIKRIGSTTSLVGPIETIGADYEDNAATDVAITADDTNDALQINVIGITGETWRWTAVVDGIDMGYGT